MELNEYDKEFLATHCKPVSELKKVLISLNPRDKTFGTKLSDCKDFKYQDRQVYCFNSKYYI